jgi:hypothetical protein
VASSDPVNPAAKRIVELVMEKLGASSAAALAKELEMPPYSEGSVSLVRRWIRGEHGPSFDYTMLMLSKAGLLTAEAERAWLGLEADPKAEARAAAEKAREAEAKLGEQPGRGARARRGTGTK